jgi:hypothetical protein
MLLETKNPQLGWIAIVLGLAVGRAAMYGPQASSRREGEREEPGGEQWHAIFRGLRRFRFCAAGSVEKADPAMRPALERFQRGATSRCSLQTIKRLLWMHSEPLVLSNLTSDQSGPGTSSPLDLIGLRVRPVSDQSGSNVGPTRLSMRTLVFGGMIFISVLLLLVS